MWWYGSIRQLIVSFQTRVFCKSRVSVFEVGGEIIVSCVCVIFLKSKGTLNPWYDRSVRFVTAVLDFKTIYLHYRVQINEKDRWVSSQFPFLVHVISRLPTWATSSLFGEDMVACRDVSGMYSLLFMRAEQDYVHSQTVCDLITTCLKTKLFSGNQVLPENLIVDQLWFFAVFRRSRHWDQGWAKWN